MSESKGQRGCQRQRSKGVPWEPTAWQGRGTWWGSHSLGGAQSPGRPFCCLSLSAPPPARSHTSLSPIMKSAGSHGATELGLGMSERPLSSVWLLLPRWLGKALSRPPSPHPSPPRRSLPRWPPSSLPGTGLRLLLAWEPRRLSLLKFPGRMFCLVRVLSATHTHAHTQPALWSKSLGNIGLNQVKPVPWLQNLSEP